MDVHLKKIRRIKIFTYSFIVLWIAVMLPLIGMYFNYSVDFSQQHFSQSKNGLWLEHRWVGESQTKDRYEELCRFLIEHEISDVFFHVGPLEADGKIPKNRFLYANELIKAMKKNCTQVHMQAWIGQVEKKGGGPLDLSDPKVKQNIIRTAAEFVNLGFDGIHYNIEPLYSDDKDFLELLQMTRKSFDNRAEDRSLLLSVAADELEPFWGAEALVRLVSKQAGFWNKEYYQKVANHVDQMAVMMYDTALPLDWLYGSLVKMETEKLANLIPSDVTLFMGVPTYDYEHWGFHPQAENMQSGIRGIQKGLEGIFNEKRLDNFGIAVYAEWVTEEEEWEVYGRDWAK